MPIKKIRILLFEFTFNKDDGVVNNIANNQTNQSCNPINSDSLDIVFEKIKYQSKNC
jgi:hypothetical protein